jgi:integrase
VVAQPDGLVFTSSRGTPLWSSWFYRWAWQPAVAKAGLPDGTRFHELRHFYASALIASGESVKTVQSAMGHASAVETWETYAGLWPDAPDRTRAAVDACWVGADGSVRRGQTASRRPAV